MIEILTEESLKDFQKSWISPRNKKFYDLRKSEGINEAKYMTTKFRDGSITCFFQITPTYAKGKEAVKAFSPDGKEISVKYYTYMVQFANIESEFEDWGSLDLKQKRDKLFDWVNNWDDTKLYCNDPSYLYQGSWFRLDKNGSSIYDFPSGLTDKGIAASKHGTDKYLTKHFLNVILVFNFNWNEILKDLDKEVKYKV